MLCGPPSPAIVPIRDSGNYIRVLPKPEPLNHYYRVWGAPKALVEFGF